MMMDENATPTACHKAIPVPIHWRDQVKAALDRDVRLGVIEPVPVGEPVTWCHRMVVTAKKNGTPRRTVNLQALNRHAKRETHHTSQGRIQPEVLGGANCFEGHKTYLLPPKKIPGFGPQFCLSK